MVMTMETTMETTRMKRARTVRMGKTMIKRKKMMTMTKKKMTRAKMRTKKRSILIFNPNFEILDTYGFLV